MLEGLQDTAIEVIVGNATVDLKIPLPLPPQPEKVRATNMPSAIASLRAMFPLPRSTTPKHFIRLSGPPRLQFRIVAKPELYPALSRTVLHYPNDLSVNPY